MSQPQPPTLPPGSAIPSGPVTPASQVPAQPRSLSIVIPSFNGLPHLIRCLKSLVVTLGETAQAGIDVRAEILVQDDCSTTFDALELIGNPAQVARNERNLGFAGNCNAGARRSQGDVLLFLNQDTKAHSDWYAPLLAAFDDPAVGIVGPKLVSEQERPGGKEHCVQSCGGLFDAGKGPYHRFLGYHADDWRVNVPELVSWTTGAALAIRRELFGAVGGFDEAYERGYFEDVDLSMKVRAAGYHIWYEPRAVFEHQVGSTGGVPPQVFKANSMRFHRTWDAHITPDTPVLHVAY